MTTSAKLAVFGFLLLATALEVTGDAIVRLGLAGQGAMRVAQFAGGAALLFGYGLALNLAPLPFERVVGVYIATLFMMWQVIAFAFFRHVPTLPVLVGGALIIAGGLVVALWQATPAD